MVQMEKQNIGRPHSLKEPYRRRQKKPYWERNGWPLAVIILILIALFPWIAWWHKPVRTLIVKVMDKTVPDRSFREHKGLFWILDHERIVKKDGGRYRADKDYIGFEPLGDMKWQIREGDLASPADLVYIADTYGVYNEEFYGTNKGNRTPLIYGGLQPEEVVSIKQSLANGGTLVSEFNSFGSPTGPEARDALCQWLGLRWSGWTGRHFLQLKRNVEIPPWAVVNYEKKYNKSWDFAGPGFLFCNDKDDVVVLDDATFSGPLLCQMSFNPEAKEVLNVQGIFPYTYWFDIAFPESGTKVLAEFKLDLKAEGAELLKKNGIPTGLPAIFYKKDGPRDLYYFAGDFLDHPRDPIMMRYRGICKIYSFFSSRSEEQFFWGAYVPVMHSILERAYRSGVQH